MKKIRKSQFLIKVKNDLSILRKKNMFFANALRDYMDQLSDLSLLLTDNFTVLTLLKSLFIYLLDSLKFILVYFVSGKWITHFIELPCSVKGNYLAVVQGKNIFESTVTPSLFEFLESKPFNSNYLITGFFNSFFLALPISVPHLLTLRAVLLNGFPAGIFAAAGTILGQFTFLLCVLFGFEFILVPYLTFEPFSYLLGFGLVVNIFYNIFHKPNTEIIDKSQLNLLLKFLGFNFLLAWTEQASVFQYFGNLTFNRSPTFLQGATDVLPNRFLTSFFFPNSFYLIGILVGSICWTIFFWFVFTFIRRLVSQQLKIPFLILNEQIHKLSVILVFSFSLISLPYYGFDYLITNPLGFISNDKTFLMKKLDGDLESSKKPATSSAVSKALKTLEDLKKKNPPPVEAFFTTTPFGRFNETKPELETVDSNLAFEDFVLETENSWKNRSMIRFPASSLNQSKKKSKPTNPDDPAQRAFFKTFYPVVKKDDVTQPFQDLENTELKNFENKELHNIENLKSNLKLNLELNDELNLESNDDLNGEFLRYGLNDRLYGNLGNQFESNGKLGHELSDEMKERKAKQIALTKNIDLLAEYIFNPVAGAYYKYNTEEKNQVLSRNLFRTKFYTNPIYKTLVHLDMVGFLQGQPKSYNLTSEDEVKLHKRRLILENYLNSVHDYKNLVRNETKSSYAEKVYNQQFKGSLDLIRHYYSISVTFDDSQRSLKNDSKLNSKKKVLKFDQPLYNRSLVDYNPLFHEELDPNCLFSDPTNPLSSPFRCQKQSVDLPMELVDKDALFFQQMEEFNSTPFYIGWDSSLRKYLIKKACTPGIPYGTEARGTSSRSDQLTNLPTYLSFQSWPFKIVDKDTKFEFGKNISLPYSPLSKEDAKKLENNLKLQNYIMAVDRSKKEKKKAWVRREIDILPSRNLPVYSWSSSIKTVNNGRVKVKSLVEDYVDLGNTLPPQFGGISWPGSSLNSKELKMKIFNLFN